MLNSKLYLLPNNLPRKPPTDEERAKENFSRSTLDPFYKKVVEEKKGNEKMKNEKNEKKEGNGKIKKIKKKKVMKKKNKSDR